MPAVYDSVLAGKAVSAEDHRLAVNTANLMGDLPRVPRLLPPHRRPGPGGRDGELPGLLPGAVGARPNPLCHVARSRLGRHAAAPGPRDSHSPLTNEQAYVDVRASVMGGLSCIFQPFAQANNPELGEEDYNSEEPVSWILYLDFNAMYPAAMSLPMPNGRPL